MYVSNIIASLGSSFSIFDVFLSGPLFSPTNLITSLISPGVVSVSGCCSSIGVSKWSIS